MNLSHYIPELPPRAWMLLGGDAFSSIGSGLVMPFLIVYLHRVRGIDLATGGAALSMLAFAGLVGGPVSGVLVDRLGARNAWVFALVVEALGAALIIFIREPWQAFVALAVFGFGIAVSWPALFSAFNSVVSPAQRPTMFAAHYALLNAGFGIGGIIGGLVVRIDAPRTFELVFALDALSFLVLAVFLMTLREVGLRYRSEDPEESPGSYRAVLRDRVFLRVWLLAVVLIIVGYSQLTSSFPAYATGEGGISTRALGFVFATNTFVIVVAQLVVLRALAGILRTRALVLLSGLWAACWLATLGGGQLEGGGLAGVVFAFALALFALGETIVAATVAPIVNDLASDALRGRYNGLYSLSWSVGSVIGPAAAGFMLDRDLASPLFVALIVGCAVAALLASWLENDLPIEANVITR